MLISAINEIYYCNSSESLRIVSLVTAFALLMLFIVLLCFTLFLSLSSYKTIENEHSKIGEIFNGFKMQRKHKIFASALLLRRLIFVAVLISLMRISSPIVIGILGFAQLVYLIITFILRPYKQVKENLILIINEIYFGSILCSLAYFNSEDKWSDTITSIYVWIFTSNSMISLTIVLVYTVKYIITKIVSRCSKSRTVESTPAQIVPKSKNKITRNLKDSKMLNVKMESSYLKEENKLEYNDELSNIRIMHQNHQL